jgi:UDP-MurNAc hydroxylase
LRLTHISNACCIYETRDFRLLADPWLSEPVFGSWVHDPPLVTDVTDVLGCDALYISHIHADHCDPETLRYFPRTVPIVCLKDRFTPAHLGRMGFTRVIALEDGDESSFVTSGGDLRLTMFGPFCKHPHHDSELGNVVDSALLVEADGHKVLNCNDNTMSLEAAAEFRVVYGRVDVAQLNSNAAGPFPACFRNLTHAEKIAERDRILRVQTDHMTEVARILGAKVVQPFAGAYKLGYGREHLNQYLPVWPAAQIAAYLNERDVRAVALSEGETLDLADL